MSDNTTEAQKRIKKLEEQVARKQAELVRAKGRLSDKERRAKNRQLFQIGRLVEAAGLLDADPGFLLGHLLKGADIDPGTERWKSLKARGDTAKKELERSKKTTKKDA